MVWGEMRGVTFGNEGAAFIGVRGKHNMNRGNSLGKLVGMLIHASRPLSYTQEVRTNT
jgi:hypothetical protein